MASRRSHSIVPEPAINVVEENTIRPAEVTTRHAIWVEHPPCKAKETFEPVKTGFG
jgi:hypothetical protein